MPMFFLAIAAESSQEHRNEKETETFHYQVTNPTLWLHSFGFKVRLTVLIS